MVVDNYSNSISELTDNINSESTRTRDAAANFAQSLGQGLNTGITDFLHGKAEEGKSAFETFLGSLLNTFTSTVINSMVEGLMNPLTGKDGVLTNMFKDLGKSLTSGLGDVFSGLGKGAGGAGIWSSIAGFFGFADGGFVSGAGTGTSDSIAARLSNGEFVVNARQTSKYADILAAINSDRFPAFAMGGAVTTSIIRPPSSIDIMKGRSYSQKSQQVFNINVTGDVSMQTRREIQQMIPQIATGVNTHNYEQGVRR